MANTSDFEAELPQGGFGALVRGGSAPQGAPQDQTQQTQRRSAFSQFFRSPAGIAAALQFLSSATRSPGLGETTASVVGGALGEAGQAAGRVLENQRVAEATTRAQDIEERGVAVEEQRAQAEVETAGRRLDIAQEQTRLDEEFRRDELSFRQETQRQTTALNERLQQLRELELSNTQELTDIERQRLEAQIDQFDRTLDADSRALATRLAAEARIAITRSSLDVLAALTKAETERAFLEGVAPDLQGVISTFRNFQQVSGQAGAQAAGDAPQGDTAATQAQAPTDAGEVPAGVDPGLVQAIRQRGPDSVQPEEWRIILSDPRQTAIAIAAFGAQVVEQKRAEFSQQTPQPEQRTPLRGPNAGGVQ